MNNAAVLPTPAARAGDAAGGPLPPPRDEASLPPSVGGFHYTRFAPALPPLAQGVEPGRHAVVIAGGGPVGMSLALGLANHGVPSVVLEADDTVCVGSRAACISRRSLEIIERLGALPAFLAKGLPWSGGRSFYKTEEVFRFEMPHDDRQKLPPMINLEQYYIEQYLLDEIDRRNAASPGLIDLRWGTELTGFEDEADGLLLDARNAEGSYRLRAGWLAACDGGQSFVRRALGLELVGTGYEGRYVIIDIELHSSHPTERRAWFDPPWNPGSTVLMHRQPDDIWRIDYQLRAGQSTEEALQPAAVREFVQRHLDAIGEGHLPWHTVWTSVYRAGAMTLESYRHGRVMFAGNAAHAMPIFGVRGLNSGFDDADNLAWKLALVARGVADASLLDSYSQERVSAFHINAENAMRSTEFMSPPSRGFDLLREAALSLAGAHRGIANLINPRQTQAVGYAGSALSSPGDALDAGPLPGEVMAEQPLASGLHLTDRLGPAFTVLVLNMPEADAALADEVAAAQAGPLPVALCELLPGEAAPEVFAALGAAQGAVYLLRPDGHVAARWRRLEAGLLQQALGRASAIPCPHAAAARRKEVSP
ncbi:FAD-dependent monooxygenase [Variovorax sp. J22P168]|uniref:FAD-dependent monooxygenase n=1 Tax=Variovorax jilinensis TaxID=3053513 RepID=UPI002578ECCE|nr:FAD-dependent monooxygenase [Variovorax sp. J22P168]MDM0010942.1 FAD-dependent monooxygenase [Variovorax sp. J22P168]